MGLASAPQQAIRNEILTGLSAEDLAELRPHLTRVRLVPGQVLIEPGQPTEHVFFVEDGMVSMIVECGSSRAAAQVAMIGREGLVGSLAILATDTISSASAVSQIQGVALRMPLPELMSFIAKRPAIRALCLGYIQSLMQQTMQTAASNAQNSLAERCIRWLLMAHDRIDGDELPITHEALSVVLGVRRASVTVVVCSLHDQGLIRAGRGRVTIVDRSGLEQIAGCPEWLGAPEAARAAS
jgi:CRP-like cAMP-binding protein